MKGRRPLPGNAQVEQISGLPTLNVKIDQEVRYRLDKDLEDAIAKNPDLF